MSQPSGQDFSTTLTSAASVIYGAVSYTDKNHLTLVDIMGLTGHAFRINIDKKQVNVAGPTSFPGGYILRRNLCNLGFISCLADADPPVAPDKLVQTITLIQQSIDRGIPAISFDLFIPEFGLIYGYDDEKQVFHAKDVSEEGTIPYAKFADNKKMKFVTTISESLSHSKYEMLRMALDMIIEHTRGREWTHIFKDNFAIGLAGYDAWIGCMERRSADEFGNAYNTAVIADAREFAVRFLRRLAVQWDGSNVVERFVRTKAGEAVKHYQAAADSLSQLRILFPFPHGGQPKDPKTADRAIALLHMAKEAETLGIEVLEQLLRFMKGYHSEQWVH